MERVRFTNRGSSWVPKDEFSQSKWSERFELIDQCGTWLPTFYLLSQVRHYWTCQYAPKFKKKTLSDIDLFTVWSWRTRFCPLIPRFLLIFTIGHLEAPPLLSRHRQTPGVLHRPSVHCPHHLMASWENATWKQISEDEFLQNNH